MCPVPFRIGDFEVTSLGVMLAIAALVGLWLFRQELRRSILPLDATDTGVVVISVGVDATDAGALGLASGGLNDGTIRGAFLVP